MRIHLLKLTIIISLGVLFATYNLNGSSVRAFSGGPDPSLTGAPGELTCSICHGGGTAGGTLSISGLPANYSPNQVVTLTVSLTQAGRTRFGFQLTAIDDSGKKAGELTPNEANPNDARTQTQSTTVNGNQRQYINHTFLGSNPVSSGQGSWTFKWTAPAQSVGRVTFYIAGNAANGNFTTTGDTIYTINQSIQPAASLPPFVSASAASFAVSAPLTANGIAAGFGLSLVPNGGVLTMLPLPTELDGTSITVNGVAAGLFFASPGQINYLIPANTANGAATIAVRRNNTTIAQGTANVESFSPGIFTADSSGTGLAAALVFRISGAAQTFEPVVMFNPATSMLEAVPIDLGPATDQVFLLLFGTGMRGINGTATATIGGPAAPIDITVPFTGAVGGFEGLDQANIPLPQSLKGRGLVNVVYASVADGKTANTVQVSFK